MFKFLSKLTAIRSGMSVRDVVTVERIVAIQDAILALASGENIAPSVGIKPFRGNGQVRLELMGGPSGTAPSVKLAPLTLTSSRPAYIPAGTAVASGHVGTWLTWGFCQGRLPTNWETRIDSILSGTYTKYFMLKVNFIVAGAPLVVRSCSWEAWNTVDEHVDGTWQSNGNRPGYIYLPLGALHVIDGVPHLFSAGGGDFALSEHISSIVQDGVNGFTYSKAFSYLRLQY